jgi:hypothetical protein
VLIFLNILRFPGLADQINFTAEILQNRETAEKNLGKLCEKHRLNIKFHGFSGVFSGFSGFCIKVGGP